MAGRRWRPRVRWVGDAALEVAVGPERPDLKVVARVQRVAAALLAAELEEVVDVVPGLRTVLVTLDRGRPPADPARIRQRVRRAAEAVAGGGPRGIDTAGRLVSIPVRYGGEEGPDLAAVARETGLSPAEVVARHHAPTYTVLALGFRPGFAFLGFLDPRLAVPRSGTPRTRVPAGSVGLAGRQTGIYPCDAPGGWRLIGRTATRLFDPSAAGAAEASLLRPGDRVRFTAEPEGPGG